MVPVRLLLFACAVVVVVADEKKAETPVPIITQDSSVDEQGGYKWSYESGDGNKASEQGTLKDFGNDTKAEVAQGNFAYTNPDDGKTYSVEYTADENGYQPKGDHLPVAPPIPPLIQRSLAYLATAPPPKEEKKLAVAAVAAVAAVN